MPRSAEDKDAIQLLYTPVLFLPAGEGEEVAAPVVILQNDPANIYGVLEKHLQPDCLPQPDRFWKIVRSTPPVPFETWRPRVNGAQLKMLQQARLPRGVAEWTAVGEAISSLGPYLQSDSNPEALLSDLHLFTLSVEQWWASRRRTAGDGPSAPKRPSQPTLLQPNGKRAAHDGLIPNNQAFMLEGSGSLPLDGIVNGNLLSDTDVALAGLMPHQPAGQRQANGAQDADHDRLPRIISAGIRESPRDGSNGNGAAAGQAAQPAPPTNLAVLGKTMVILNVGGLAFSTTAATLTSVEGSYFQKLAMKASSGAANEFFIDRSGTLFHHVLDHLRGQRYGEPIKGLPEDVRELQLLQNEAAFYRLPQLERQAADAAAAAGGEVCDAIYIQTGFVEESGLDDAHMHLLLRLNAKLASKHDLGFRVTHRNCGTENRATLRNIWYHILLSKRH